MDMQNEATSPEDQAIVEVIHTQLQHFRTAQPPCRGVQLPDGILLRHTLSRSLFFYLRTGVENGKIHTRIYATDSPYDRQKADIGVVTTPMFEPQADHVHLEKLEQVLKDWVTFVRDEPEGEGDFQPFYFDNTGR